MPYLLPHLEIQHVSPYLTSVDEAAVSLLVQEEEVAAVEEVVVEEVVVLFYVPCLYTKSHL